MDAGLLAGTGKFGRAAYRGQETDDLTLDVRNTTTVRLKIGLQWSPARRSGVNRSR